MRFVSGCFASLLCIAFGMYIFPNIFQMVVMNKDFSLVIIICTSIIFLAAMMIILTLLARNEQGNKSSYQKFVFSAMKLIVSYLICILVVSMLSGVLATCVYHILKDALLFDQIKGIINLLIAFMTFLLLPLFINFFWDYIQDCQTLRASLKNILQLNFKTYCSLLIMVIAFYGCGVLITTLFNFLPTGNVYNILQMLIFTLFGGIGFSITGSICERGGNV